MRLIPFIAAAMAAIASPADVQQLEKPQGAASSYSLPISKRGPAFPHPASTTVVPHSANAKICHTMGAQQPAMIGSSVVGTERLPRGVTLQPVDGGPNYYAGNGFICAANAGWDNPNFFPIGPWTGFITNETDVNRFKALDWNTSWNVTGNSSAALARANGISLIQDINNGLLAGTGSETVGLISRDEPTTFAQGVSTPLGTTPNSLQDNRFWWINNTWNFIAYGGIRPIGPSSPAYTSSYEVLSSRVTTPDRTTRHIDASSIDIYWFSGSRVSQGAFNPNLVLKTSNMTGDQIGRGSNYGTQIDLERLNATNGASGRSYAVPGAVPSPTPIWAVVENGGPYSEDVTGADYIQASEMNWAIWSSIIHGARGVIYFNQSFAGPARSYDNMGHTYYHVIQSGQSISIYDQARATNALIKSLAPVINSPFAVGYVTVSPVASLFNGIEVMAKYYAGQFYLFACTRESEAATNISATFTLAGTSATSVTVINESRTIPVVHGLFTDTFATAATVHIYQVN